MMKRILAQTAGICILLSGVTGNAYSATGDTTAINITINVKARTCQFDKASQTVELSPVRVGDFVNTLQVIAVKEVPVGIKCSSSVDTVKIKVSGTPAYFATDPVGGSLIPNLFRNTGTAKNIGLAFMDKNSKPLSAIEESGGGIDYVAVEPENGQATYVFKAGYQAMSDYPVTGGTFASSVNLTFDYD
ncbi:fimbrial protein [Enterobacter kobei]